MTPVHSAPMPRPTGWPAAPGLPALGVGERVHLVGIAGAGMRGLAHVMLQRGLRVSGSDQRDAPALQVLRLAGAVVHGGHAAEHVPASCRLVVRSAAVPDDNVELRAAQQRHLPIGQHAELLGALLDEGRGVAVAGTHGKTTTTGWLATVLLAAGQDPAVFVGGHVPAVGGHARAGGPGELVIAEADEYAERFLHGHPWLAVITNVEHDHPDVFPDEAAVVAAFRAFMARVRSDGAVLYGADAAPATPWSVAGLNSEGFAITGEAWPPAAPPPTWRASSVEVMETGQAFDVHRGEERLGRFQIALHGRHAVVNGLATVAAATWLGLSPEAIRPGLGAYPGPGRRAEVIGRAGHVTLVDDYAHHPTEISATLEGARARWPHRRLWTVLQPHTFSRVQEMAPEFAAALEAADQVLLAPVYGARESAADFSGISARRIAEHLPGARCMADMQDIVDHIVQATEPHDVVLFLSAGDLPTTSRMTWRALQRRATRQLARRAAERELAGSPREAQPLARYTSLRVGGPADLLIVVRQLEDLVTWLELARMCDAPVRLLGRGTNVLVPDGGLPGLVLINRCEDYTVDEQGEQAVVHTESGVTLAALGHALSRAGWAGLEAAVGIPGSVGGSVVTNAGAHGWTMSNSLVRAEILEPDGRRRWLGPEQLAMGYRSSVLKGDPSRHVLRCDLRVTREDPTVLQERIARYTTHRRRTQPTTPSVGSIFRNPEGDFAGRLIEESGLKGTQRGGAEISPKHANFFINRNRATAADLHELIALAQRQVARDAGVLLELEIEPLGDKDDG